MSPRRLVTTARRRAAGSAGDDGSIIMVFGFVLFAATLTVLVLGMVAGQASLTRYANKRVQTLHAAQAGLDAAIGQIRSANDGTDTGDRSRLPCLTSGAPLTGTVRTAGVATYRATVTYFDKAHDPTTHQSDSSWLAANALSCADVQASRLQPNFAVPAYALVTSTGAGITAGGGYAAGAANRTLATTYVFRLTNANLSGGPVRVYDDGSHPNLCMDAGSATPPAGTPLTVQRCVSGSVQQTFAYRTDLTLLLISSVTTTTPNGMCLSAPATAGANVAFQPCATPPPGSCTFTTPACNPQQWSYNDQGSLNGSDGAGNLNNLCFNVGTVAAGTVVNLSTATCSSGFNSQSTWNPDRTVGAGAAGAATQQLVNFYEFGRCLDVTNQDVTSAFLIDYPCKQAPNPANVRWNQHFAPGSSPVPTQLKTTTPRGDYCLQSPMGTSGNAYVLVVPCATGQPPANQLWTITGQSATYAAGWTIVDRAGLCLGLGAMQNPPGNSDRFSTINVGRCDGSLQQKWNAPPDLSPSTVQNTNEK